MRDIEIHARIRNPPQTVNKPILVDKFTQPNSENVHYSRGSGHAADFFQAAT